jgi:hypothetical protein
MTISYLAQKLNLFPDIGKPAAANLTLHEVENALSELLASMFWTSKSKFLLLGVLRIIDIHESVTYLQFAELLTSVEVIHVSSVSRVSSLCSVEMR